MKTLRIVALMGVLGLFSGCEIVEELVAPEFDVNIAFDGSLSVVSDQLGNPLQSIPIESEIGYYNILNDPDVMDAMNEGDEITAIKINSVRYSYSNYVGDPDAFIVEAGTIDLLGFMNVFSYETPDFGTRLRQADLDNESFTLIADYSDLEQNLKSAGFGSVGIRYRGIASHNPVEFDVVVFLSVTLTIKPDF